MISLFLLFFLGFFRLSFLVFCCFSFGSLLVLPALLSLWGFLLSGWVFFVLVLSFFASLFLAELFFFLLWLVDRIAFVGY